jgi:hypothetical protein
MIAEWLIENDLKGNDHGLIEIIMLTSYGRLKLKLLGRLVSDDIRTLNPQIKIYVIATWTDLAVEDNWRERTENNFEKNLLQCHVVCRLYQIGDEATRDWDANVKPFKTGHIFNETFL